MVKAHVWADRPPCCSRASSCLTLITMATDREEEREGVTAKSGWWVCNKRGEDLGVDWRVEVRLIENCNGTKKKRQAFSPNYQYFYFLKSCALFAAAPCFPVWRCCSCACTKQFGVNSKQVSHIFSQYTILPPSPQTQLTGGCFLQHLHIFARHWPLALGWRLPFCPALPHCRTTLRLVSVI